MSQRAICRCPLCQLERHIINRLEQEDSVRWFRELTARTASLSGFGTMRELIAYAHSAGRDADKRRVCDGGYIALLRELSSGEHTDLLHSLLLRMLAPGLHRELRGMMAVSFPGIDRNDLTQQLITNCFEIMRSPGILKKNSYIAASLVEWTKRGTYRWAIRQYRTTDNEETRIVLDDVFEARDSQGFESKVHLRELLEKALADRTISADDVKLLTAYEIEGVSGEELGKLAVWEAHKRPSKGTARVTTTLSAVAEPRLSTPTFVQQERPVIAGLSICLSTRSAQLPRESRRSCAECIRARKQVFPCLL